MLESKTTEQIQGIARELIGEVVRLVNQDIWKVILYGSYARGDYTEESDIDIMLVLNCGKEKTMQYRKAISRLSSRMSLENDVEISVLLRDRETFEAGQRVLPFYQTVLREGIALAF